MLYNVRLFVSVALLLLLQFAAGPTSSSAQPTGEPYVLLIGGLGGSPQHTSTFQQYLYDTHQVLTNRFQIDPSHITVLAASNDENLPFIDQRSTAQQIQQTFTHLTANTDSLDQIYILLFGHGSYDGQDAYLNIPRQDLSANDFADLLDQLPTQHIVFINTTSSSGPFINALSRSGRIVIAATRTGTERHLTRFPQHLVEALNAPSADTDKDNRLSIQELFVYAAEKTARWYTEQGHLASEHALLDATGDGEGVSLDELSSSTAAPLAATTYVPSGAAANPALSDTASNDSLAQVHLQQRKVEEAITSLKREKPHLPPSDYYQQLERLLVQLARLSKKAEAFSQAP